MTTPASHDASEDLTPVVGTGVNLALLLRLADTRQRRQALEYEADQLKRQEASLVEAVHTHLLTLGIKSVKDDEHGISFSRAGKLWAFPPANDTVAEVKQRMLEAIGVQHLVAFDHIESGKELAVLALELAGGPWSELVKEDYSVQSLSAIVREMRERGEALPPVLQAVLEIREKPEISIRGAKKSAG